MPSIRKMIIELKRNGITELYVRGGNIRDLEDCPVQQVAGAYYDHMKRKHINIKNHDEEEEEWYESVSS